MNGRRWVAVLLLATGFLAGFAWSRFQLGYLSGSHPSSSERPNPILGGQIRWADAPSYLKKLVRREIHYAEEGVADIGNRIGEDLQLSYQAEDGYGYLHPNLTACAIKIPVTLTIDGEVQGEDHPLLNADTKGDLIVSTNGHFADTKLFIGKTLWLWRVNTGSGYRELESDVGRTLADTAENEQSNDRPLPIQGDFASDSPMEGKAVRQQ